MKIDQNLVNEKADGAVIVCTGKEFVKLVPFTHFHFCSHEMDVQVGVWEQATSLNKWTTNICSAQFYRVSEL